MEPITQNSAPYQHVAPPSGPTGVPNPTGPRYQLRRSRSDRMISGVCGGVAKLFNIDANLVRIGLVALTIVGVGTGAVLYVAAWLLVPEEEI